jgi:putative FmdB family regulatory protein
MPIYEYECITCGATFEKRQSFSDVPVADCPNGHSDTRRLFSAPAIVFKGSGFYINDSKTASKQSANGTSKSDKSESSTDSGTSTGTSADSTNGGDTAKADTKAETKATTDA